MDITHLLETSSGAHSVQASNDVCHGLCLLETTKLHSHQVAALFWMAKREKSMAKLVGGVLADGPGLGKTLTTLSCMLLNQSNAPTLVVVPNALIVEQWLNEMILHFQPNTWKTLLYNPKKTRDIQEFVSDPHSSKIILVTLQDMTLEWHLFQSEQSERGKATSVLYHVKWHRIVVDEVQDILGPGTSMTATMIQSLHAEIRWGLSATPLSKPIDLLGLGKFLMIPPLNTPEYWRQIDLENEEHVKTIQEILNDIVWRTPSQYVVDTLKLVPKQIQLPAQIVQMSAVEFASYYPEYKRFMKDIAKKVKKLKGQRQTISINALRRVLAHESIIKLCKGASHVGLISTMASRDFDSMLLGLVQMRMDACNGAIENCIMKCIESNDPTLITRGYQLFCKLGPFRIPWTLQLRLLSSIRHFAYGDKRIGLRHQIHRTVLAISDKLPRILWEKIFNEYLYEDFSQQIDMILNTQRDAIQRNIMTDYNILRQDHGEINLQLGNFGTQLNQHLHEIYNTPAYYEIYYEASTVRINEAKRRFGTYERWAALHKAHSSNSSFQTTMENVYTQATSTFQVFNTFLDEISTQDWTTNSQGLLEAFDACDHGRRRMNIQQVLGREERWRVRDAANAQGRGAEVVDEGCFLCRFRSVIEVALDFWRTEERSPTLMIRYLLSHSLLQSKTEMLRNMVIEYCQKLTTFTTHLDQYIRRSIEVWTQMQPQPTPPYSSNFIRQVDGAFLKLESAQADYNYVMKIHGLQKQYESTLPACDFCKTLIPTLLNCRLLLCSHTLCIECCQKETSTCPICQNLNPFQLKEAPSLVNPMSGSKYDKVIQDIARVEGKSIVFSQWHEGLKLLRSALHQNNISSLYLERPSQSLLLEEFQKKDHKVLLLPLKKYNHGLNLVEATHVFLLEPTLQPEMQQQAMARVQRLSQTQTTYVHRYVMAGTIEKGIFEWTEQGRLLTHDDVYQLFNSN
ncbi:snf2 histone linker PHD ring helicase [Thraustotheca clavata]|uniref:Snf2 histone linker PHD ring helicase n=1 Tax=Thraustotheca clavata TaxID=74557 RepID=A0A1W0ACG4_9STRA|nr:snf2 histone linker PHD ring helicase [Thraustotheca clavata]